MGWLDVLKMRLCYSTLLLSLLPTLAATDAETTTASPSGGSGVSSNKDDDEQRDMLVGLAAGFGFFFGLILCVCLVWCLCCTSDEGSSSGGRGCPDGQGWHRSGNKVSPSPPHSGKGCIRTRSSVTSSSP